MKSIKIFLLVLIIIGLGLLVIQKMWVPGLVNHILKQETPTSSDNSLLTPNTNIACTLKTAFDPQVMFTPKKTSSASGYPWVTGFKGSVSQLSWVSQDPSIVKILPPNTGDGSKIIMESGSEGVTAIVITDNSVSKDCVVSFKATTQNFKESGE